MLEYGVVIVAILVVAALIAVVFGRKTAQNFLGNTMFTIGLIVVVLFGLGVAMFALGK